MIGFKLAGEALLRLTSRPMPDGLVLKPMDPNDDLSWAALLDMRARLYRDELGGGKEPLLGRDEWRRDLEEGIVTVSRKVHLQKFEQRTDLDHQAAEKPG